MLPAWDIGERGKWAVVTQCRRSRCWGMNMASKQRWFRMRQEEELYEFLESVRGRVVGRGGSQEKLLILLTNHFPLVLLHGVPRFRTGRDGGNHYSVLSPFSCMRILILVNQYR